MKRIWISAAIFLAVAATVAACGSDDTSTSTAASTGGETLNVANSDLGQILVDQNGMTVYLFEKDTSGDASTCSGECAADWPPVAEGKPTAGDGIDAAKLTTFKRDDGSTQVAYNSHPLYLYAGDSAPGDTTGNGLDLFGAEWYAMTSTGEPVSEGEAETTSDSPDGGYSY